MILCMSNLQEGGMQTLHNHHGLVPSAIGHEHVFETETMKLVSTTRYIFKNKLSEIDTIVQMPSW